MKSYPERRVAWLAAEQILAQAVPFGSVDYIRQRETLVYRRRLGLLGESLPSAARFAAALAGCPGTEGDILLMDPVVRASIDDLLRCYRNPGGHEPEAAQLKLFDYYGPRIDELRGEVLTPEESIPQTLSSRPIRLWTTATAKTFRDQAYLAVMRQHLPGLPVYTTTPEAAATVAQALELLGRLLPDASRSATGHLAFIVLDDFDEEVGSATISRILGTVFLSRYIFKSTWTVAEAILHECMHLKFVELEHTHSMLGRNYQEATSPRIHPSWHPDSVTWPVNRALTAAHVYVTLALYTLASREAASEFEPHFGPCKHSRLLVNSRTAAEHARSLVESLRAHEDQLGQAGRLFLTWMSDLLNKLDALIQPDPRSTFLPPPQH
ncbi:aKG-HExxH-type peptide beta-hydroxylase, partial [Corallococcus llansteffanensis]